MSTKQKMNGFAFAGYRSFGSELAKIAPLNKINFIIGQNNCGKSNVINFLSKQYPLFHSLAAKQRHLFTDGQLSFEDIDRPLFSKQAIHRIGFPLALQDIKEYLSVKFGDHNGTVAQLAKKVLHSCYHIDDEFIWFIYGGNSLRKNFELEVNIEDATKVLSSGEWHQLWRSLSNSTGGNLRAHWVPDALKALAQVPDNCPKVEVIPAIRRIGAPNTNQSDHSGEGIIERLALLQNPALQSRDDRQKFESINKFVQKVLENDTATIEVPYERDMVLVHMDQKTLPLQSLGTGIHEVVILASAATILDNTILCVEEPELHLHPGLQRKLIKYLATGTNNQYIFTTHSAHLMDAVESEIFHVALSSEGSFVRSAANDSDKSNVCKDLGYKASDILQANCVIWVEGPSDRVYLNHWIQGKRCDLVEGVHYSIMFYGGRLFSHLTAQTDVEENLIEDLIAVRRLNQNSVIVFDSDRSKAHARLSATKTRLRREFNSGPGFAWVTQGREVENYLEESRVQDAVKAVHPSVSGFFSTGQWANLLVYKVAKDSKKRTANKVKVARNYVENNNVTFSILDLNKRVNELIEFISRANSGEI